MDPDLVAALEDLRLSSGLQQKLVDLGIKSKKDLSYINQADLKKVGFKLVQQRKVLSLCDATSGAKGKCSEDEEQEDRECQDGEDRECQDDDCALDSGPPMMNLPGLMSLHSLMHHIDSDAKSAADEDEGFNREDTSSQRLRRDSAKVTDDGTHLTLPSEDTSKSKRKSSMFWHTQRQGRPMRLIFIRHGESEANVNRKLTQVVPDHALHLTAEGRKQALDAGVRLRSIVNDESVRFIVSPYVRTRETLNGILRAWDQSEWQRGWVREDVRIREQEYGNYDSPDMKKLHSLKKEFGPFYYRFPEGESIADCYDRASLFVESLYRTWIDNVAKNHVIVGHGMMILVMLSRLLRLPVDEMVNLDRLTNCEFIVLERPIDDAKFHISYTWGQGKSKDPKGLRRNAAATPKMEIWSGDPAEPLLTSQGEASMSSS